MSKATLTEFFRTGKVETEWPDRRSAACRLVQRIGTQLPVSLKPLKYRLYRGSTCFCLIPRNVPF